MLVFINGVVLGGVVVGLCLWLYWRKRLRPTVARVQPEDMYDYETKEGQKSFLVDVEAVRGWMVTPVFRIHEETLKQNIAQADKGLHDAVREGSWERAAYYQGGIEWLQAFGKWPHEMLGRGEQIKGEMAD